MNTYGLKTQLPYYVTRKTADGYIGSFYMSAWLIILAQLLLVANVILWGLFGIVAVFWLSLSAIF